MKLGRASASARKASDLKLADYVPLKFDAPPLAHDWTVDRQLPWLMNNKLGCCTITGIAHLMQNMALENGRELNILDTDIIVAYSATAGYVVGDDSTDQGGVMVSALTYARKVGIGGRKIGAYARVDMTSSVEVQAAIFMFGGIYVGADLPLRIREQSGMWALPKEWDSAKDSPNSLGGHAYIMTGYDRDHYRSRPWRDALYQSVEHAKLYVDEAWAIIDERWVTGEDPAPNGFDIDRLRHNLRAI